ncbi:probable 60S ribosomal protein L14 [Hevea brasiliensis]|uniref:probable 60S ribosomal protein L14 n=1 Tax=Hevea brasiliensis TaxID=3981 RepID=UPI0025FA9632|nr:probable 60S ribosomal protein L14 [Hevea brasiliensis]
MPFKRYVEIERVALINYGIDFRKLGVFVDVIDQNRVTIGTPNMVGSQINFKRRSPILRLKLAVSLSEIGLQAIQEMDKENVWKKIKMIVVRRILVEKFKNGKVKHWKFM